MAVLLMALFVSVIASERAATFVGRMLDRLLRRSGTARGPVARSASTTSCATCGPGSPTSCGTGGSA